VSTSDTLDLAGTAVLVTGASSGIGRATALLLAASGANVALAARRQDRLLEVRAAVESAGVKGVAVPTDVALRADADRAVAACVHELGRLDAVVNCAGVMLAGSVEHAEPSALTQIFQVNVLGTMHVTAAAVADLRAAARSQPRHVADIVNVSSIVTRMIRPDLAGYCASKSAIESYSESCRREFADSGIRVCTLVPGSTETELLAPNAGVAQASLRAAVARRLPADDVASAIVWLLQRPARAAVTTLEIRPLSQV
jgi:NADP-dependent 3-hydroxy acid dehydrogenase YdfG